MPTQTRMGSWAGYHAPVDEPAHERDYVTHLEPGGTWHWYASPARQKRPGQYPVVIAPREGGGYATEQDACRAACEVVLS